MSKLHPALHRFRLPRNRSGRTSDGGSDYSHRLGAFAAGPPEARCGRAGSGGHRCVDRDRREWPALRGLFRRCTPARPTDREALRMRRGLPDRTPCRDRVHRTGDSRDTGSGRADDRLEPECSPNGPGHSRGASARHGVGAFRRLDLVDGLVHLRAAEL